MSDTGATGVVPSQRPDGSISHRARHDWCVLTALSLMALSSAFSAFGGSISQFYSYADWSNIPKSVVLGTEDFNSYDGYLASPVTGTIAGAVWKATAPRDLYAGQSAGSAVLSVDSSLDPLSLSFQYSDGLSGVGGNIFSTDINFDLVPGEVSVMVTLADNSSRTFSRTISDTADFWGFYSSGSPIASIRISPGLGLGGSRFSSIDNLTVMHSEDASGGNTTNPSTVPETGFSFFGFLLALLALNRFRHHAGAKGRRP